MSNLEAHAKTELTAAGLFDKDSDYNGMIGEAVMDLMKVFASQGHSGFSANLTLEVFSQLAQFKVLTPITSTPDEWIDRSEISNEPLWQNNRQPSVFSKDGGQTWYDLDNPENTNK